MRIVLIARMFSEHTGFYFAQSIWQEVSMLAGADCCRMDD